MFVRHILIQERDRVGEAHVHSAAKVLVSATDVIRARRKRLLWNARDGSVLYSLFMPH